jgi:Holliday junction DNA helicase RuvA
MISHVSGTVDNIEGNKIVIDVAGVGYSVHVPATYFSKPPKIGDQVKLFTHQVVREDLLALYGFQSKGERRLFETLLSVSGIGPKGALSIISEIPMDKLITAIVHGNVETISSVKGIGRKTAEKMIIELKEKVAKSYAVDPARIQSGAPGDDETIKDSVSALMTLGYSSQEARKAIERSGVDMSGKLRVEEVVRKALSALL